MASKTFQNRSFKGTIGNSWRPKAYISLRCIIPLCISECRDILSSGVMWSISKPRPQAIFVMSVPGDPHLANLSHLDAAEDAHKAKKAHLHGSPASTSDCGAFYYVHAIVGVFWVFCHMETRSSDTIRHSPKTHVVGRSWVAARVVSEGSQPEVVSGAHVLSMRESQRVSSLLGSLSAESAAKLSCRC